MILQITLVAIAREQFLEKDLIFVEPLNGFKYDTDQGRTFHATFLNMWSVT